MVSFSNGQQEAAHGEIKYSKKDLMLGFCIKFQFQEPNFVQVSNCCSLNSQQNQIHYFPAVEGLQ